MDGNFIFYPSSSSNPERLQTDLFLGSEFGTYSKINIDNLSSSETLLGLDSFGPAPLDLDSGPQSSQDLNFPWDWPLLDEHFQWGDYDGNILNSGLLSSFDFPIYPSPIAGGEVLSEPRPKHTCISPRPQRREKTSKPPLPGAIVLNFGVKRKRASVECSSSQQCKKLVAEGGLGKAYPKPRRAPNGSTCIKCKLHKGQCDGNVPCGRCVGKMPWQPICMRAKLDQTCFSKDIYASRVGILIDNIQEWLPASAVDMVLLEVGFEFPAILPLRVNRFIPKRKELLDHISFRISSDAPLDQSPSEPWGLLDTKLTYSMLATFLDQIIPDMLQNEALGRRNPLLRCVLQLAHKRCLQLGEKQDNLLRKLLRMWAAQTSFFERAWRIRGAGAVQVNARFHENLNAADVPRMLYWQLDCIMEDYLSFLERDTLKDLDLCIFPSRGHYRSPQTLITVFIAAFAYLMLLESDSWTLKTWETKSNAWGKHPRLSQNPTMIWPVKRNSPNELIKKNEEQANAIANRVKALNHGRCLSTKELRASNDDDIRRLGEYLEGQIGTLAQLRFRGSDPYQEKDPSSLDYTYLSKMLLNPDEAL